jgi:hypothetical protein
LHSLFPIGVRITPKCLNFELLVFIDAFYSFEMSKLIQLAARNSHRVGRKDFEPVCRMDREIVVLENYHPKVLIQLFLQAVLYMIIIKVPVIEDSQIGVCIGLWAAFPALSMAAMVTPVGPRREGRSAVASVLVCSFKVQHEVHAVSNQSVNHCCASRIIHVSGDHCTGIAHFQKRWCHGHI